MVAPSCSSPGQRAARSSRKVACRSVAWHVIGLRLKAIDARILFVEAAMNAPRRPAFPQWKIDLVRDALTFIEGEMGGPVMADDCKENPFTLDG